MVVAGGEEEGEPCLLLIDLRATNETLSLMALKYELLEVNERCGVRVGWRGPLFFVRPQWSIKEVLGVCQRLRPTTPPTPPRQSVEWPSGPRRSAERLNSGYLRGLLAKPGFVRRRRPTCLPACLPAGCLAASDQEVLQLPPTPSHPCPLPKAESHRRYCWKLSLQIPSHRPPSPAPVENGRDVGGLGEVRGDAEVRAAREKVVVFCLAVLVPLT